MELLKCIPLYFVIVTVIMAEGRLLPEGPADLKSMENVKILDPKSGEGSIMCARLAKQPYFGVEMLLGREWRIYYTWNMDLRNQCMDMTFRNATPAIINRIYNDMSEYIETQPYWDAATVLASIGRSNHEMLLFADQGSAGRFQGVPNIIRDGNMSPAKASVPLLNFHLKLLYGGKYLLMADCHIGVSTLLARKKNVPYRAEIGGIASTLDLGPGLQACLTDKNGDEENLKVDEESVKENEENVNK